MKKIQFDREQICTSPLQRCSTEPDSTSNIASVPCGESDCQEQNDPSQGQPHWYRLRLSSHVSDACDVLQFGLNQCRSSSKSPRQRSSSKSPRHQKAAGPRRRHCLRRMATLPSSYHAGLRTLARNEAMEYIRMVLRGRYCGLRRAFKEMDIQSKGSLTSEEFRSGLEAAGISWPDDGDAVCDLRSLFAAFSTNGSKTLSVSDLMGPESANVNFENMHGGHPEHQHHSHDWIYMTTMEKWHVWCEDTAAPEGLDSDVSRRAPHWELNDADSRQQSRLEKRRDASHARMRRMLEQGTHKTRDGLKLTAWHLPAELDSEAVQKYRRSALEEINQQSHRIREAITQTTQQRRALHCVREQLEELERQANAKEFQERAALRKSVTWKAKGGAIRSSAVFSVTAVNLLSEDGLSFHERQARDLARDLGVDVPHVEAVQAVYDRFDPDGKGITWRTFPKMLAEILDVRERDMASTRVEDLWRLLNTDGDSRISLPEYLSWHFDTSGAHGPVSLMDHRSEDQHPMAQQQRQDDAAEPATKQAVRRVRWDKA